MKTFSTSFIAAKNQLEGGAWCSLIDLVVNVNTTARFTSWTETLNFAGNIYMPVPFQIGDSEQSADGSLAQLTVDVSNYRGMALKFIKDNDVSLNDVTVRMVNPSLTNSGQEDMVRLQILNAVFVDEAARFTLGYSFSLDVEGPRLTYNRRDYPGIPVNANKFFIY